jgi:hypothetical protein
MHETLSKFFKGYIDKNYIQNDYVFFECWIAGNEAYSQKDIRIFNPIKNSIIPSEVIVSERRDVYNFFGSKDLKYLNCGIKIKFFPQSEDCFLMIKNELIFSIKAAKQSTETLDEIIKLNSNAKKELIVVNNFYENPDKVRKYALTLDFKSNESYHKGNRTEKKYIPSWVKAEFSRLLGKEVKEFVGASGVFQYCIAKDALVYHFDYQQYAAMVYLSPNAPLQTGTQTFRSKLTGLFAAATDDDAQKTGKTKNELNAMTFNGNNFYDRFNMELVDSVANVYNRCVIFNAQSLHAAAGYYGDTKENSRLFHLYFFNC